MTTDTVSPASTRRSRTRHKVLVAAGAAAVLLGVLAELTGYLPGRWQYLSQAAYPWLLGAFGCGAAARTRTRSAGAGVGFLLTGLAANTAFKWAVSGHDAVRPMLEHEWPGWLAAASALGVVYGLAGWARTHRLGAAAAVAAGFVLGTGLAESAADATGALPWTGTSAAVLVVLVAISAVVVLRGFTGRQLPVAGGAALAVIVAVLGLAPLLPALALAT